MSLENKIEELTQAVIDLTLTMDRIEIPETGVTHHEIIVTAPEAVILEPEKVITVEVEAKVTPDFQGQEIPEDRKIVKTIDIADSEVPKPKKKRKKKKAPEKEKEILHETPAASAEITKRMLEDEAKKNIIKMNTDTFVKAIINKYQEDAVFRNLDEQYYADIYREIKEQNDA